MPCANRMQMGMNGVSTIRSVRDVQRLSELTWIDELVMYLLIGPGSADWWIAGLVEDWHWVGILANNWSKIDILVKDGHAIGGLMMDWYIVLILTLDWKFGLGLGEWQKGLALEWHLCHCHFLNNPPLRHFDRSHIVLVPLSIRGIELGLALGWHCGSGLAMDWTGCGVMLCAKSSSVETMCRSQ